MTILDHLENHLGPIEGGWSKAPAGQQTSVTVVRLGGGQLKGCRVFATVGLSNHTLASRVSSKLIRQELVFIAKGEFGDRNIPGLLDQAAVEAIETHKAYLRGDILGPRGPLFNEGAMEALYVGIPVYLADSFASFRRDDGDTTVLAWLVPIAAGEARFVATAGWEAFEDELVKLDPDLADPLRPPIALPLREGTTPVR